MSPRGCLGGNDGEVEIPQEPGKEQNKAQIKVACLGWQWHIPAATLPALSTQKSWCKTSKSWNKKIKKLKKIEPAYGRLLLFGTTRFGKCRSCVFKPFPFLLVKQGGLQLCCYFCKTRSENPLMLWFKNTRLLPNMAQEEFLFTFAPQCPQVCLCK